MLRKDLTWQIRNTVAKMSQGKKFKKYSEHGVRMGQGGGIYIYSNLKKIFLIFKLWGLTSVKKYGIIFI